MLRSHHVTHRGCGVNPNVKPLSNISLWKGCPCRDDVACSLGAADVVVVATSEIDAYSTIAKHVRSLPKVPSKVHTVCNILCTHQRTPEDTVPADHVHSGHASRSGSPRKNEPALCSSCGDWCYAYVRSDINLQLTLARANSRYWGAIHRSYFDR